MTEACFAWVIVLPMNGTNDGGNAIIFELSSVFCLGEGEEQKGETWLSNKGYG